MQQILRLDHLPSQVQEMPDVSGYTQFSNNERLYVGFEELEQARNLAASEIAAEQLSVRGWGR